MKEPPSGSLLRYHLDSNDCITYADSAWSAFAKQNDAPELAGNSIIGQSIWDHIGGTEVRHLYEHVFASVRSSEKTVVIPFRCDAPALRRFMELRVEPDEDGNLSFESFLIREEVRPEIGSFSSAEDDAESFLRMCSWCKKIQLDDGSWVEIEEAIRALDLFQSSQIPAISHGICNDCAAITQNEIDSMHVA